MTSSRGSRPCNPRKVVDLGCGPGNLTATLAERWPEARVVGIDSSEEMLLGQSLVRPAVRPSAVSNAAWNSQLGDIAGWLRTRILTWWSATPPSNGFRAIRKCWPAWLRALKPGAWFAMQVPGNFTSPSHTLMRELAESRTWSGRLGGVLRHDGAVGSPADYLGIMLDAGCSADAWETTYQQVLQGEDPVLEWVRGTGLRPVLAALTAEEAADFEDEYSAMLREAYPATSHGTVFPFRRIFAVAQKPA